MKIIVALKSLNILIIAAVKYVKINYLGHSEVVAIDSYFLLTIGHIFLFLWVSGDFLILYYTRKCE